MLKSASLAIVVAGATFALSTLRPLPTAAPAGVLASDWPLVQTLPHPDQWVVVEESAPYVVPTGAIFVATAVGTTGQFNEIASAFADGVLLVRSTPGFGSQGPGSMLALEVPLPVLAGTTLSVVGTISVNNGRLWGYLVRASDRGSSSSSFELPPPEQWIAIQEGAPYQVPAGKLLVMTALDFAGGTGTAGSHLVIDGQREVTAYPLADWGAAVRALPVGLTVQAGSLVEPRDFDGLPPATGRAWGFLIDAP